MNCTLNSPALDVVKPISSEEAHPAICTKAAEVGMACPLLQRFPFPIPFISSKHHKWPVFLKQSVVAFGDSGVVFFSTPH
jgi:hypothetical protein